MHTRLEHKERRPSSLPRFSPPSSLDRLRAAVALIPKLETFTASVIATVAKGHSTAIDAATARAAKRPATRPPSTPKAVLTELQKWQRERCGGASHD